MSKIHFLLLTVAEGSGDILNHINVFIYSKNMFIGVWCYTPLIPTPGEAGDPKLEASLGNLVKSVSTENKKGGCIAQ